MNKIKKSIKKEPKKYSVTKKVSDRVLTAYGWMRAKLQEVGYAKKGK